MSNRAVFMCVAGLSLCLAGAVGLFPIATPEQQPQTAAQAAISGPIAADFDLSDPITKAVSREVLSALAESDPESSYIYSPGRPLSWYQRNWAKPCDGGARVEACFAPGTPPDVVTFIENTIYDGNLRYQLTSRWSGAQGTPRALTWSFVPDGLSIPGGAGEPTAPSILFSTMDTQFTTQGGRATWISRFQSCFDRWSALTGLSYTRVTFGGNDWDDGATFNTSPGVAGLRGDCRIGSHNIDGGSNILAYNQFPPNGDMVLDSSEAWNQNPLRANYFLRNVVSHEHGHGIGLLHVCPSNQTKLMEPFISARYDTQQHDDIRAGQRQYGDPSGNNNTPGAARALGLCEIGSPINAGVVPDTPSGLAPPANSSTLSIDGTGEQDYYTFSVAGPRAVTITVTPRGTGYASYTQDSACSNAVINEHSLITADLAVDLIDTNGTTVLTTAASQPTGNAETITGINLAAAGTYYIRVYATDSPTESQLYLLDVSVDVACSGPAITPITPQSTVCGSPFNSSAPSATGTPAIVWSLSGSPPAGVTIDPGTGVVSWPSPTPSLSPYALQVTATNACGSDTKTLSLTVLPGDFNGDGVLDELDIGPLVDHLLGFDNSRPCAADVNFDSAIDGLDVAAWIDLAQ